MDARCPRRRARPVAAIGARWGYPDPAHFSRLFKANYGMGPATTAPARGCDYATAKHALVGLMRTLAKETAPRGIRVNTIHPGPVDNEFQHRIEVAATGAERDRAASIFEGFISAPSPGAGGRPTAGPAAARCPYPGR